MRSHPLMVCLAGAILTATGCYPRADFVAEPPGPRAVEVFAVRSEPLKSSARLVGRLEPWREATLHFEIAGVVADVLVEEGATVAAGDVIARLEPTDYELAVAQARSERNATQAKSDLLKAGTRQEDLDEARALHARSVSSAAYWAGELERKQKLAGRGTVTASELDEVRRQHALAYHDQRAAKAALDRAIAGPRQQEIEEAAAAAAAREQALATAQRQLDKATLRAPFAGRVERRQLDPGAYINLFPSGGAPVARLVDLSQVDAVVAVPETLLERFHVGEKITVVSATTPARSGAGEVIAVGQAADRAAGTYEVRVRLTNDGRFTAGMVVVAEVPAPAASGVAIPLAAIRRPYGQPPQVLVAVGDPPRAEARPVTLGGERGSAVEITAGLSPGDRVIVGGQHLVAPGDLVAPTAVAGKRPQGAAAP